MRKNDIYALSFFTKFSAVLFLLVLILGLVSCVEQITYPKHEESSVVGSSNIKNLSQNIKVALLFKATVEPVYLEINRWPYFTVNDLPIHPVAFMDNTSARQECLVNITSVAVRIMSGLITRKDGVGAPDPLTEIAHKELNALLHVWGMFGATTDEPESKIKNALYNIDKYYEKMEASKEIVVNFNPDVLQEIISFIMDVNSGSGILDISYSKIIEKNSADNWFNLDERFYCGQAGARVVHSMLSAIYALFPEEVNFRGKQQHLNAAIEAFYVASNLNPVIILETTNDVYEMFYYYTVGLRALERYATKQTKNN